MPHIHEPPSLEASLALLRQTLASASPVSIIRLSKMYAGLMLFYALSPHSRNSVRDNLFPMGVDPRQIPNPLHLYEALGQADLLGSYSFERPIDRMVEEEYKILPLPTLMKGRHFNLEAWNHVLLNGEFAQSLAGKRIVLVGARMQLFKDHFIDSDPFNRDFPQLGLASLQDPIVDIIPTPDFEDGISTEIDALKLRLVEAFKHQPDIFLFAAGYGGKILPSFVKSHGYSGIDIGASFDRLMGLASGPCQDVFLPFYGYQHPQIELTRNFRNCLERVTLRTTQLPLYQRPRKSLLPQIEDKALWHFKDECPTLKLGELADTFEPYCLWLYDSAALILDRLKSGEPFSLLRLADSDAMAMLLHARDGEEAQIIRNYLPVSGLTFLDDYDHEGMKANFSKADFICCQQPYNSPFRYWVPAFEALQRAGLVKNKTLFEIHTIFYMLSTGMLFDGLVGKRVVLVGGKAPFFMNYFYRSPSYRMAFPFLKLHEIDFLDPIPTPESFGDTLSAKDAVMANIRATYSQTPHVFLVAAGTLSRYLITALKEDGYTGIDIGAGLDSMMNFPVKRPYMDVFYTFEHQEFAFEFGLNLYQVNAITDRRTGEVVYRAEENTAPSPTPPVVIQNTP